MFFLILFLIIVLIFLILSISLLWGLIETRGVPFISTNRKLFKEILEAAEIKAGETIYDLGCGKASLLIKAAKDYGAKGIGYEISLWPYLWAKFNIWCSKADVKIYFKNFFQADLSQADVVFCYLFPEVMAKLEPKFQKELKPGSRVVSYAFKLPRIEPSQIIATNKDDVNLGRIFVYKKLRN